MKNNFWLRALEITGYCVVILACLGLSLAGALTMEGKVFSGIVVVFLGIFWAVASGYQLVTRIKKFQTYNPAV